MIIKLQKLKVLLIFFLSTLIFISCEKFVMPEYNEPVKSYLEYWASTCQVGKVNFISENVTIDDIPNLSASKPIEIDIIAINPKKHRLLCKEGGKNFSLTNESGTLSFSGYSEKMEDSSLVKITAVLTDESEGQVITLAGGLWPENRQGWQEAELKDSFKELFTSVKFIQNTPPDNIKNLTVPDSLINRKHYVSFELPDQSLNRNAGSTYEIAYYLRETDGNLYYKGTKTLSLSDNKNPASSNIFFYYFDEQEDNLSYEYTVQVKGPRKLKSEILSTVPGLGVKELCEPDITFGPDFTGKADSEGYQYIELPSGRTEVSYSISTNENDADVSGTIDGKIFNGVHNGTLPIGKHTIVTKIAKNNCRAVVVTRKIKVVKELQKPSVNFYSNYTRIHDSQDAEDTRYREYGCYNINLTLSGTGVLDFDVIAADTEDSVSVRIDGSSVTSDRNLELGPHILTLSVSRPDYITRTFTEKVYVQGILTNAEINPVCTSFSGDNYEFSYLTYDSMPVTVTAGNIGNTVEVLVNDVPSSLNFSLDADSRNNVKVMQSRQYCKTPAPLVKQMNVKIKPITLEFNNHTQTGILDVYLSGFSRNEFDLKGQIRVEYNYLHTSTGNYEPMSCLIFGYESAKYGVTQGRWQNLNDSDLRNHKLILTSPSDEIRVSMEKVRRNVGGGSDEQLGGGSKTKLLSDLKMERDGNFWIFISDAITGNGRSIKPRIKFTPGEE